MLQSFKAVDGQSTYDICLNTYGTLDYLIKMLQDSGFTSVDDDPATGDAFTFDDDLIESQAISKGAGGTILIGKIYATSGQPISGGHLLIENGGYWLLENGSRWLLEDVNSNIRAVETYYDEYDL